MNVEFIGIAVAVIALIACAIFFSLDFITKNRNDEIDNVAVYVISRILITIVLCGFIAVAISM